MADASATTRPGNSKQRSLRRHERVLNVPLVIGTLVTLVVLAGAIYGWRTFQVGRLSDALLVRADALEGEADWEAAAAYLHRYLQLRPDDVEARIRLAQSFDRSVQHPRQVRRAIELHYHALGLAPQQHDLRRRLAQLLFEQQRFAAAQEQAERLLAEDPSDADANRILALTLYAGARAGGLVPLADALTQLEQALALHPDDIQLAMLVAAIYRDELQQPSEAERAEAADAAVAALLEHRPDDADAHRAAYEYCERYRLPDALRHLQRALELAPDDSQVLTLMAEQAADPRNAERNLDRAKQLFEQAVAADPLDERPCLGLSNVLLVTGDRRAARHVLQQALQRIDENSIRLNAALANLLLAEGEWKAAAPVLEKLEHAVGLLAPSVGRPQQAALTNTVDLLRAKSLLSEQRPQDATVVLRRILATQSGQKGQDLEPLLLLGQAYAMQEQWELAGATYARATELQAGITGADLAAAAAWEAAGRPVLAQRHLERVVASDDAPATAWLSLAKARLQEQMQRPRDERIWSPFHEALEQARTALPDAWQVPLLEVSYLIAENHADATARARDVLQTAGDDHGDDEQFWPQAVAAYGRLEAWDDASRALQRVEALSGRTVTWYLLREGILSGQQLFDESEAVLHEALKTLPRQQHPAVQQRLAHLALARGKLDSARQQLIALAEENPGNVSWLREIAELDLETGNVAHLETWEDRLREAEGADGLTWRVVRATRLIHESATTSDPRMAEAEELLDHVLDSRPAWGTAVFARATLADRRNRVAKAIAGYERAVELGDRRISTAERLVELLVAEGRFADAERELARLVPTSMPSRKLQSLAILLAAQQGQLEQALQLAREAVESRPGEHLPLLLLGQILALSGQWNEAEQSYRQAIEHEPSDSRPWLALLNHFLLRGNDDAAEKLLSQLAANQQMADVQRAVALADGYKLLGKLPEADANYAVAANLAPDDVALHNRWADFLMRVDPRRAATVLRKVLALAPEDGGARRQLAIALSATGSEAEWAEALQLLQPDRSDDEDSALDDRLRAVLLAGRIGTVEQRQQNRAVARDLLERLVNDSRPSLPTDRLLLAGIYEEDGRIQSAKNEYRLLVNQPDAPPDHLRRYVDFLLRQGDLTDAEVQLGRLELMEREASVSTRFETVGRRARLLQLQERSAEIEPLVEGFAEAQLAALADHSAEQEQLRRNLGRLYDALEKPAAAERWYRRLDASQGDAPQLVARSLVEQGRTSDAVKFAIDQAPDSPAALINAIELLMQGSPTDEDFHLVESLLSNRHDGAEDVERLFNQAMVHAVRHEHDQAIALFEKVVRLAPNNAVALNNLATLLAERPERRGDALGYVHRAIELVGRDPALLDTQGTIYLHEGRLNEAVACLEEAVSHLRPDPRYYFHLALAYQAREEIERARDALSKADKGRLESQHLTSLDRRLLKQLRRALQ